jgi:hypothetical protein
MSHGEKSTSRNAHDDSAMTSKYLTIPSLVVASAAIRKGTSEVVHEIFLKTTADAHSSRVAAMNAVYFLTESCRTNSQI